MLKPDCMMNFIILSVFFFSLTFTAYSFCGPPSYWAKSLPNLNHRTENLQVLYNKLKQEPDTFLERLNMQVASEDLEPGKMNSSKDLKIMLYEQGYLKLGKRDGTSYKLYFPQTMDFELYRDLVYIVQVEDYTCREALYKIKRIFEQIPPEIYDFKSLMFELKSVLRKIPKIFDGWELRAIFGTFYLCGLNVTVGGTPIDSQTIYHENLPNNTRMLFIVDNNFFQNAKDGWDKYYRDLLLPGRLDGTSQNILAVIVTLFRENENNNSTIRDWYGVYRQAPDRTILREYKPA